MTSVIATPASTASGATTPPKSAMAALDTNAFLKLLVAELQYQDPTKPMDTTQLVQQLSSMSEVEQSAQTNAKLSSILDQLALGQATSLIGHTVTSADGTQSGIIKEIRTTETGMEATLVDGSTLSLEQGITISQ